MGLMKLTKNALGYLVFRKNGKLLYHHIVVAEAALGRPVPDGAEVHHVDGDTSNSESTNLVICPSHAYHFLIELRTKAYEACGDPNKRKCTYCKQWDDPVNLYFRPSRPSQGEHISCRREHLRGWTRSQKGKLG